MNLIDKMNNKIKKIKLKRELKKLNVSKRAMLELFYEKTWDKKGETELTIYTDNENDIKEVKEKLEKIK